MTGALHR